MSETLKIVEEGKIVHVVLNRPEVHNAFNAELITDITKAFAQIEKMKDVRVVILRSEGKNFCAGGDLNWMKAAAKLKKVQNEKDAMKLHHMFEGIRSCSKPVIAQVQGMAFGGGVGLTASADIVIASHDTYFGLTEVKLGLIPSVIAPFVIRKIGPSNYNAYAMSAKRFSSLEALRMGLVHEVASDLNSATRNWVFSILEGAPEAQKQLKNFTDKILTLSVPKAGVYTSKMIAKVRVTPEAQEGLAAFLEKRKPKWV